LEFLIEYVRYMQDGTSEAHPALANSRFICASGKIHFSAACA
jgi:hypothetical protein